MESGLKHWGYLEEGLKRSSTSLRLNTFNLEIPRRVLYVLRRVRGKLYSINRPRPLTDNVMKILYQAHILPIIDYCDVVWVPTNSCHLKRLERVHSRFVSSIGTNCPVFKLTLIE